MTHGEEADQTPPEVRQRHRGTALLGNPRLDPYVDWSKAERAVFTQLKPTTRSITLRLPETLLAGLKTAANQRDVPYQSLIKVWLAEKLEESEAR